MKKESEVSSPGGQLLSVFISLKKGYTLLCSSLIVFKKKDLGTDKGYRKQQEKNIKKKNKEKGCVFTLFGFCLACGFYFTNGCCFTTVWLWDWLTWFSWLVGLTSSLKSLSPALSYATPLMVTLGNGA